MNKKRLLIVTNTMGRAGAENALLALLKTLDPDDFDIDLMSVINRGELFASVPEYVNVLNEKPDQSSLMTSLGRRHLFKDVFSALFYKDYIIRHLPYLCRNVFLQLKRGRIMLDKLFWHALAMRAPAVGSEYDLALAFLAGTATYYVAERVKARKKASFIQVDYGNAGYIRALDKPFFDVMDAIFLISDSLYEKFKAVYPEYEDKMKIFQHVLIPDELFAASKRGEGFCDGYSGVRILTIARLHPQKAFEIAVPAFAKFAALKGISARWYIIGEGAERPRIEKLIAEHGLEDRLILMGATDNPSPYWDQCDIYVQATHYEGWSISLASALVFNKPCIVSNVTGNKEQITNDETGIIIDLSEDNLARALHRLVNDKELRDRFSRNLVKDNIDYARDIRLLYDLIEE